MIEKILLIISAVGFLATGIYLFVEFFKDYIGSDDLEDM